MPDAAEATCVFCAIIRGDTAAVAVLETEHLLAFLIEIGVRCVSARGNAGQNSLPFVRWLKDAIHILQRAREAR